MNKCAITLSMSRFQDQPSLTDRYVSTVIAQAITDVASQQYDRLSAGLDPFEIVDEIAAALRQLEGLSRGDMPAYDDWDALCYLTWYQPHRINLAYTMLCQISRNVQRTLKRAGGLDEFRWIDFGCGSLPLHTALYAALASKQFLEGSNPRIFSYGIDSSAPMAGIGHSLLRSIGKIDPRLTRGSEELITTGYSSDTLDLATLSNDIPTILSVMHVFYRENRSEVEAELKSLIAVTDPELIIVTVHPASVGLVDRTFSCLRNGYEFVERVYDYSQRMRFKGRLVSVERFRESLAQIVEDERVNIVNEGLQARISDAGVADIRFGGWDGNSLSIRRFLSEDDIDYIDDTDMAVSYLRNHVTWTGAEVLLRVYFRQQ